MTDKTAFEKYWEDERGNQMFLRNRIDKSRARVIWNEAIDAAIDTCKKVQQWEFETDSGEECAKQIQKLRSE